MTTSTTSPSRAGRLNRPAIDRLLGLSYFRVGLLVADTLRRAPHGKAKAAIAKLMAETGYSWRFLYDLARLPVVFTSREYRHWLPIISEGKRLSCCRLVLEIAEFARLGELLFKHHCILAHHFEYDQIDRRQLKVLDEISDELPRLVNHWSGQITGLWP
ncbi:MAG TPA: hypothetical protein VMP01_06840 [Pirellulaceae bacterium]|nr:hypothetical protein [Pirellulaceae bacterium]